MNLEEFIFNEKSMKNMTQKKREKKKKMNTCNNVNLIIIDLQ